MSVTEVRIADDQMKIIERMSRSGNSAPSGSNSGISMPNLPNIFGGASTAGNLFGDVMKRTTDSVNKWREANSQFGISMSNDAIGFGASVKKSRMSMDEFMESVDYGSSGFARIGGTMSESSKIFLKISTDMADSGMADQLKHMGFTTGEYNKLLSYTLSSSRSLNLQRAEDQAKATQSVMQMATEMDKVAKLTGTSRKEQEQLLLAQQKDVMFQAYLRNKEDQGIDMQLAKQKQITAASVGLGDIFKQVSTGGAMTKEVIAQLDALGPEVSGALIKDIREMGSSDKTVQEAASKRFDQDMMAASERMLHGRINQDIQAYRDEYHQSMYPMIEGLSKLDAVHKIMKEQGVDQKTATDSLLKSIERDREGKASGTGEKVTGAATTEATIAIESRLQDLNKKQAETAEALNASLARLITSSDVLSKMQAKNAEGQVFADYMEGAGPGIDEFNKNLREGTTIENIIPIATKMLESGTVAIKNMITTASEVILNTTGINLDSSILSNVIPGEATGSKAVWGDWFSGPAGLANIRESGPEAVVPYNLVPEFINDMQSKFTSIMQPNMPAITPPPDFSMPTPSPATADSSFLKDISDQLNKLNTSMTQLVRTNTEILENSSKQYRATKQLSPNLNAR